jgi:uncharacterized SAM-binding protein YcdF (DUF218 family)
MTRTRETSHVACSPPVSETRARGSRSVRVMRIVAGILAGIVAVVILTYVVSSPLLTLIGEQLVHVDPLERVDAMVVLASGMDRVIEAAELYRSGYAPLIVLTRDPEDPTHEFLRSRGIDVETSEQHRQRVLRELGVPGSAIVVLGEVIRSTADEARVFARWSSGHPIRSVIIVTSPAHSARSRLTFVKVLQDQEIRVLVHPSKLVPFRSDTWWHSRDTLREVVIEWQKLVYYRMFEL